jgi:outer membrane biosynthesis protein TonB
MSDAQRLTVCLLASLCLHYFAASLPAHRDESPYASSSPNTVDTTAPSVALAVSLPVRLEHAEPEQGKDHATPDERRRALKKYIEQVTREVHSRRRIASATTKSRAGNTLFQVTVDAMGRFRNVCLTRSSGLHELDDAARAAVLEASGVVERPACLGNGPLIITLDVKFQFGL